MFDNLLAGHLKLVKGWIIPVLFLLFLLANFVIVPAIYPKFQTLDTLYSYTPEQAYDLIRSYGEQGRWYYAIIEATLDLAYPLVTALMFSLINLYTFKLAFPGSRWVWRLSLLPYILMLADFLENACVTTMLLSFPRQLTTVALVSGFLTRAKFILTPLQLLWVVGLLVWGIRALSMKVRAWRRV